ncbi:hypothetical protein DXG03_007651, partial [Asterophora parasitica]
MDTNLFKRLGYPTLNYGPEEGFPDADADEEEQDDDPMPPDIDRPDLPLDPPPTLQRLANGEFYNHMSDFYHPGSMNDIYTMAKEQAEALPSRPFIKGQFRACRNYSNASLVWGEPCARCTQPGVREDPYDCEFSLTLNARASALMLLEELVEQGSAPTEMLDDLRSLWADRRLLDGEYHHANALCKTLTNASLIEPGDPLYKVRVNTECRHTEVQRLRDDDVHEARIYMLSLEGCLGTFLDNTAYSVARRISQDIFT